jgi:predicted DNA-binding protein (MmcQ/YjbR family)
MHIELLREVCLSKKGTEETLPFGPDTLVFKLMGKMFALTSLSEPNSCNLKCDPDYALELRAEYDAIKPGYHMNKQHWNTITYNLDASDKLIIELVQHSYDLVVSSLPKKVKAELEQL